MKSIESTIFQDKVSDYTISELKKFGYVNLPSIEEAKQIIFDLTGKQLETCPPVEGCFPGPRGRIYLRSEQRRGVYGRVTMGENLLSTVMACLLYVIEDMAKYPRLYKKCDRKSFNPKNIWFDSRIYMPKLGDIFYVDYPSDEFNDPTHEFKVTEIEKDNIYCNGLIHNDEVIRRGGIWRRKDLWKRGKKIMLIQCNE